MVQHVYGEITSKMSSASRRKSENCIDNTDRNKLMPSDKKMDICDKAKGENDIGKLDIGEHYMVKRGDMWREYSRNLVCTMFRSIADCAGYSE